MTTAELVLRATQGDGIAAERLLRRYVSWIDERVRQAASQSLLNFAGAEDLAQTVQLRAFRGLPTFSIDGDAQACFEGWLATLVRRVVLDSGRKRKRALLEAATEVLHALPDSSPGPSRSMRVEDFHAQLERALETLPEDQRTALALQRTGKSAKEIARQMDRSVESVESLLWRARESLRRKLSRAERDLPSS